VRRCLAHFPEQPDIVPETGKPRKTNKWTPVYITSTRGADGQQQKHAPLPERAIDECPRSVIDRDPEAYEIVMLYLQAERMGVKLGDIVSNEAVSDWPVWVADAAVLLCGEERLIESALRRQALLG
jgi:hypothetical protein